jgi:hypothetical protein
MNMPLSIYNVVELDKPLIEELPSLKGDFELKMDYEKPANRTYAFKFSLRINRPVLKKSLRVKHGYTFSMKSDVELAPTEHLTAEIFSWLVVTSLNKINQNRDKDKIQYNEAAVISSIKKVLISSLN